MNIKKVSEITGLTKKAIKYYEEEGLITPEKNRDNGYREYDGKDVIRLNLITALRALGVAVNEINKALDSSLELKLALNNKLEVIDTTIENLKNAKIIIKEIIDRDANLGKTGADILKLKDLLNMEDEHLGPLLKDKLEKVFPGIFGSLFVINFMPFLNIKLDSEEKKKAFIDMVSYLDSMDEFIIGPQMEAQLKFLDSEEARKKFLEDRLRMVNAIIKMEGEEFESFKKQIMSSKDIFQDKEFRKVYLENKQNNKGFLEALKTQGYYQNITDKLKIINPLYAEYCTNLQILNDEMGVVYDDDGVPSFKK